jgi:hypothetical protein
MEQYSEFQKKMPAGKTALSSVGRQAGYLQDNRPQSALANDIFQKQPAVNNGVFQLARTKTPIRKTLSGHGKLRRGGRRNAVMKFKVPKGQTITRPAPPGATLGNLSMLLNEQKGLSKQHLRRKMKISTTPELWGNKKVVRLIKYNATIPKTTKQAAALEKVLKNKPLLPGEKISLASLERNEHFEKWAESHVKPHTFKTFSGGQQMEDMQLTPFEPALKSATPHSENEYVGGATNLSGYVRGNPGINDFTVNACSYDHASPFTGFQIDQK